MTRVACALVSLVLAATAASARQDPAVESPTPNTIRLKADAARPHASVDTMAWLAGGTWKGDGFGGVTEEAWSAPAAGAMIGTFRSLKPAGTGYAVSFYQFLSFIEQNGSLVLRLKHFNADLTGWEEKDGFVTFRLAKVTPDAVYFDGLTFRREGRDAMTLFLALRDRSGVMKEEVFRYTRVSQ